MKNKDKIPQNFQYSQQKYQQQQQSLSQKNISANPKKVKTTDTLTTKNKIQSKPQPKQSNSKQFKQKLKKRCYSVSSATFATLSKPNNNNNNSSKNLNTSGRCNDTISSLLKKKSPALPPTSINSDREIDNKKSRSVVKENRKSLNQQKGKSQKKQQSSKSKSFTNKLTATSQKRLEQFFFIEKESQSVVIKNSLFLYDCHQQAPKQHCCYYSTVGSVNQVKVQYKLISLSSKSANKSTLLSKTISSQQKRTNQHNTDNQKKDHVNDNDQNNTKDNKSIKKSTTNTKMDNVICWVKDIKNNNNNQKSKNDNKNDDENENIYNNKIKTTQCCCLLEPITKSNHQQQQFQLNKNNVSSSSIESFTTANTICVQQPSKLQQQQSHQQTIEIYIDSFAQPSNVTTPKVTIIKNHIKHQYDLPLQSVANRNGGIRLVLNTKIKGVQVSDDARYNVGNSIYKQQQCGQQHRKQFAKLQSISIIKQKNKKVMSSYSNLNANIGMSSGQSYRNQRGGHDKSYYRPFHKQRKTSKKAPSPSQSFKDININTSISSTTTTTTMNCPHNNQTIEIDLQTIANKQQNADGNILLFDFKPLQFIQEGIRLRAERLLGLRGGRKRICNAGDKGKEESVVQGGEGNTGNADKATERNQKEPNQQKQQEQQLQAQKSIFSKKTNAYYEQHQQQQQKPIKPNLGLKKLIWNTNINNNKQQNIHYESVATYTVATSPNRAQQNQQNQQQSKKQQQQNLSQQKQKQQLKQKQRYEQKQKQLQQQIQGFCYYQQQQTQQNQQNQLQQQNQQQKQQHYHQQQQNKQQQNNISQKQDQSQPLKKIINQINTNTNTNKQNVNGINENDNHCRVKPSQSTQTIQTPTTTASLSIISRLRKKIGFKVINNSNNNSENVNDDNDDDNRNVKVHNNTITKAKRNSQILKHKAFGFTTTAKGKHTTNNQGRCTTSNVQNALNELSCDSFKGGNLIKVKTDDLKKDHKGSQRSISSNLSDQQQIKNNQNNSYLPQSQSQLQQFVVAILNNQHQHQQQQGFNNQSFCNNGNSYAHNSQDTQQSTFYHINKNNFIKSKFFNKSSTKNKKLSIMNFDQNLNYKSIERGSNMSCCNKNQIKANTRNNKK